jgi:hypothetical protein
MWNAGAVAWAGGAVSARPKLAARLAALSDHPKTNREEREGSRRRSLAVLVRNGLIASGVARPPRDPNRPNYLQKKRLQRVRQAESRKRRAAEAAAEQEV